MNLPAREADGLLSLRGGRQDHGFSTSLQMDAEALERLFAAGEPPLLRVTVTVQDNN
jgi:hypothetical protein